MTRLGRYRIAGQPQHVIHRGNNRQAIFKHELSDEQYRRQLLQTILGSTAGSTANAVAKHSVRTPRKTIIAGAALATGWPR